MKKPVPTQELNVEVYDGETMAEAIFRAALRAHGRVTITVLSVWQPPKRRRKARKKIGFDPPKES